MSITDTDFGIEITLRAKGTLVSQPQFLPLATCKFPTRHMENGHFLQALSFRMTVIPVLHANNRVSQGLNENRGSLISVPLALREMNSVLISATTATPFNTREGFYSQKNPRAH